MEQQVQETFSMPRIGEKLRSSKQLQLKVKLISLLIIKENGVFYLVTLLILHRVYFRIYDFCTSSGEI